MTKQQKAARLREIKRAHYQWLGVTRWDERRQKLLDDESELRKTPVAHQRAWGRIAESIRDPLEPTVRP